MANEPKHRNHVISIRYKTPSRRSIVFIVSQQQDENLEWMVPTITTSERIPIILESGQFAKDVACAYITAAYFFDQWMLDVKMRDDIKNKISDPGEAHE